MCFSELRRFVAIDCLQYVERSFVLQVDKSQQCTCKGRLRIECLDVDKYILANTDILLRMFPHEPRFCLWSDQGNFVYRITVTNAGGFFWASLISEIPNCVLELQVPRIFPKHASLLKMHKAIYGFTKTRMLAFTHLKEVQDFGPQIIASGPVPKRIFIAVSTEQHYLGAYDKNRFNFKAYNVENVLVRYQSAEFPYRAGYRMSYGGEHPNYIDAWLGMYTELGQLENPSFNISWENYENGSNRVRSSCRLFIPIILFVRLLFLCFQHGTAQPRSSTDRVQFVGDGGNRVGNPIRKSSGAKHGNLRLDRIRLQLGVIAEERRDHNRSGH
jgi:hypothetical protein